MLKQMTRFFIALGSLAVINVVGVLAVPITGKVVDVDGKPVANAQVFVFKGINEFPPVSSQNLQTDQAGIFKTDLNPTAYPAGTYGIATVYVPGFALSGWALKSGENIIKLLPTSSIRGMVKDAAGKPVAGALVKLEAVIKSETAMDGSVAFVPDQLKDKFSAKTGDDGQWVIGEVPAAYKAAVLLDDPRYVRSFQLADTGTGQAVTATLIATLGASVAGKVVFEDGKPAPGIKVNTAGSGSNPFGANAVTDANGAYLLTGLMPGATGVSVADPSGQWVAVPVTDIKTAVGETAQAPNSILIAGAFVTGTVTDKNSGVPVADVSLGAIGAQQSGNRTGVDQVHTDKAGHYKIRVVPGKNTVSVFDYPKGYMPLTQPLQVEVGKGETKDFPIQLTKGLSATGVAKDADGRPAANIEIKATLKYDQRNGEWVQPVSTTTDANGKWTLDGLRAGQWDLASSGAWDITQPQSLLLPTPGDTQITVHKVNLLSLQGRVVTPAQKPVAGVVVKAQIQVPDSPNSTRMEAQAATTTADGHFTLTSLRPDSKISFSPHIASYKFLSGGKVTTVGQAFVAEDIILEPLTAKVTGQVVDGDGKPVAGARIMSPDGDAQANATSDAEGHFTLSSLPAANVYVVAGFKGAVGEARDVNGKAPVTLKLKPVVPAAPDNLQRAYELLEDMWATDEGNQYNRAAIPVTLAPYNPDLAVKLCAKQDGTVDSEILSQIISVLAIVNPGRAVAWAPSRLPQIQEPDANYNAKVKLALASTDLNPDLAKDLYNQCKVYAQDRDAKHPKENQGRAARSIQMSRLAARLGLKADADQFAATAVAAVQAEKDNRQWLLGSLVALNPDLAEKMLAELPADQRKQALQTAASTAARYDLPTARRIYDKLVALEKAEPNGGGYSSYVMKTLVEAMLKTDLAGALALVHSASATDSYYRPIMLAMVAQYEPKEVALPLLREASTVANGQYQAIAATAQVASIAYDIDPLLGSEVFATAKAQMDSSLASSNDDDIYNQGDRSVAEFAYYYSRLDPAISRLMLEAEFAKLKQQPATGSNVWQRNNELSGVVAAMAAVDVDRALEMTWAIPPPDKDNQWNNPQTEAQLNIARYLLLPDKERHAKGFRDWDKGNNWE